MKLLSLCKKAISVGTAVILLACTLAACRFTGYKGDFPAFYTVAVNSLLAVQGYHSHGDALIKLIEEDSFGRSLFSYYEDSYFGDGWPNSFSFLICQKFDETHAYYYPDYNFISKEWNGLDIPFSDEEIEAFKIKNGWNEEMNEEELTKAEIIRIKNEPKVKIERKDFDVLFQKIAKEKGRNGSGVMVYPHERYLTSDAYGRTLYYVSGVHKDENKEDISFDLAVIFNPDGSYNEEICVMELIDLYNYQEDLKLFKKRNHWDEPI